ncbi:MAG: hypothetical protein WKF96_01690 [Solirubrobacteraceae bacterium]
MIARPSRLVLEPNVVFGGGPGSVIYAGSEVVTAAVPSCTFNTMHIGGPLGKTLQPPTAATSLRPRAHNALGSPSRPREQLHANRARVFAAADAARPDRIVARLSVSPALPTAAWIIKPTAQEAAH